MEKLLVIDDSIPFLKDLELLLKKRYNVVTAYNGKQGLDFLRKENFTAVLLDIKMPGMTGLEVLEKMNSMLNEIPPVIIVSDSGEIETVVKAMKLGAYDYVQKDFNLDLLTQKINNALEKNDLKRKLSYLNNVIDEQFDKFVFVSPSMEKINNQISRYANMDCNILLKGETGVGKDLIAYEIFKRSELYNKIFVQVPLASISENLLESELFGFEKGAFTGADKSKIGKLESANGGTLYMPEISTINENTQLKLLQFMQYKTIAKVGQSGSDDTKLNVRIIFATNEDLEEKVKQNKLRSDFFFRIDSISITIPPLRERKEDIEPLAIYFAKKHSNKLLNREITIDNCLIEKLKNCSWLGNVRQLNQEILKAVAQMEDDEECLTPRHFSCSVMSNGNKTESNSDGDYEKAKREFRINYFTSLLKQTNNNYTKAAELAGISRTGLDKALKELGIKT